MRALGRSLLAVVIVVVGASCTMDRPEVASVGGVELTPADLDRAVSLQQALGDLQGAPCGQPIEGETQRAACERVVLSGELLWLAVAGYAERNDLGASKAAVDGAVGQLEAQVGAQALDEALAGRSVTREDLDELGRRLLTIRAVRTAVASDRVGDDELRRLYEEQALDYTVIDAAHILVKTRGEAEDVSRRVRDATLKEFEAVARQVSTEPGADESGGALGSAAASRYAEPFARAAVALDPGEVSEPVQTQFGWHVIYLIDKTITPFDEARSALLEPLADREFKAWLTRRAEDLDVEVNPRYGRFSADTFSVTPAHSTDPEASTAPPTP